VNSSKFRTVFTGFAAIVIPVLFVVAVLVFLFVMGNPENFQGNNTANLPKTGNYLGTIYKGGIIVPILMTILLMVITFSIERWITLTRAKGKGSISSFVVRVYQKLGSKDLGSAIDECDRQRGSVANVIKAGLLKYKEVLGVKDMNKDQKVVAIKQEIEEATSLEMPILEQNLVILATIAPLATLLGLLGTVLGMIRAFSALATAGAPDAVALATGISEALINTAFGIGSSALAIIFYSYFSNKIDKMTYNIDEAGVAIVQNFISQHS
jgi:biopolymer transport protein ExbB